ncbi:MAG: restriction endonuclease subunit S [Fibrobacteres bacterium]|nr:restriction endonuclease subunit S [Fibrobacterota bacterium]
MIDDLKPYPEYKDSGLPWMGQIPSHWILRRIKSVLQETDSRSSKGTGTLLSLTRVRGLISRRDMTDKVQSAKTLVGYKEFKPGQLVMNRMQAWSGMFGSGDTEGLVSPDYAVFRILGEDRTKFLLERLKAPDLVSQFALESKGIGSGFNRLYSDRFGAISISAPTPDEQAAIVRFLGHLNRRVDQAIRSKRKLIALLNEQKQAIIQKAVTRGLDPNVPLKDSGIPWLGQIPAHWDVTRLLSVCKFRSGRAHEPFVEPDGDHVCVNSRFVSTQGARVKRCTRNLMPANMHDVLMVMSDLPNGRALARAYYVSDEQSYAVNQRVCCLTAHGINSKFLYYYSNRNHQLLQEDDGSNQTHLPNSAFTKLLVVLPPPSEQIKIVGKLDSQVAVLDKQAVLESRAMDHLIEYRTRLVSDVVTGKLDVRAAAAKLPPELEESDSVAESEDLDELDDEAVEEAA